jgi:hypothetical protein
LNNFKDLFGKIDSFETAVRRRLMKIEELWPKLTAFYFRSLLKRFREHGTPATRLRSCTPAIRSAFPELGIGGQLLARLLAMATPGSRS